MLDKKVKVQLVYPSDEIADCGSKEIELTAIELNSLLMCNGIGSEGKYFEIKSKIFEDTKEGYDITLILEENQDII